MDVTVPGFFRRGEIHDGRVAGTTCVREGPGQQPMGIPERFAAALADPSSWAEPAPGLVDSIVAMVTAERARRSGGKFGSEEIRGAASTRSRGMWDASDEGLLAGYATGDREAASAFVRRFQGKMIGLALHITRDRVEAEEVAQDAFVRAWRYAASFDPRRGSVAGWLLGIVRNVALDHVRVSGRRRELHLADLPHEPTLDDVPDVADLATDHDVTRGIVTLMDSLPREQRQTLLAVTLHGFSARETSEAMDVPLGTVKTRIRLALRKLRDQLAAEVM